MSTGKRDLFVEQLKSLQDDIAELSGKLSVPHHIPNSRQSKLNDSFRSTASATLSPNIDADTAGNTKGQQARLKREVHELKKERDDLSFRYDQVCKELSETQRLNSEYIKYKLLYENIKHDYESMKSSLESSERIRKQQKELIRLLQRNQEDIANASVISISSLGSNISGHDALHSSIHSGGPDMSGVSYLNASAYRNTGGDSQLRGSIRDFSYIDPTTDFKHRSAHKNSISSRESPRDDHSPTFNRSLNNNARNRPQSASNVSGSSRPNSSLTSKSAVLTRASSASATSMKKKSVRKQQHTSALLSSGVSSVKVQPSLHGLPRTQTVFVPPPEYPFPGAASALMESGSTPRLHHSAEKARLPTVKSMASRSVKHTIKIPGVDSARSNTDDSYLSDHSLHLNETEVDLRPHNVRVASSRPTSIAGRPPRPVSEGAKKR